MRLNCGFLNMVKCIQAAWIALAGSATCGIWIVTHSRGIGRLLYLRARHVARFEGMAVNDPLPPPGIRASSDSDYAPGTRLKVTIQRERASCMNGEEKAKYLANIYHLLIADGEMDRGEERVFDDIRRDIRAGYTETQQAKELAQQDAYQVQVVGRWSDRIANLEDMLFAAFSKGTFERTEQKVIQQYTKQLGINQTQLDIVKQ